jgi:hypothetical protein
MPLDPRICSRARLSCDARFDGRFFIGVPSTRIYSREIRPVRTVKKENVRYLPTAAAAAEAGTGHVCAAVRNRRRVLRPGSVARGPRSCEGTARSIAHCAPLILMKKLSVFS